MKEVGRTGEQPHSPTAAIRGDPMPRKITILQMIRLFLAITFIAYGTIKILGGQFIHEDFVIDSRTTDGATLVWSFFGYSPVYGRMIGLAELIPGILLLFSRTRTVGALILLPVSANIAVMDFCFHFPAVKYFALLLTVLCAVLVAADYRKLQPLFWDDQRLKILDRVHATARSEFRGEQPASPRSSKFSLLQYALLFLVGLPAAFFVLNLVGASVGSDPVDAARARCVQQGWEPEDLQLVRWTMTGWSSINREGQVEFAVDGAYPPRILRVAVRRSHSFVAWEATGYEEPGHP
jgi:hypothetical protein